MTPIVITSLPEDHDRVRKLVEALHGQNVDLWWERIDPAQPEASLDKLMAARCVIFTWTEHVLSDAGAAYRDMAEQVRGAGKVISVKLEKVAAPDGWEGTTVIDLSRWKSNPQDVFLLDLAAAARAKAAGLDPPPQRGPVRRKVKQVALLVPTVLGAIGIISTLVGFYHTAGLDEIASAEEAAAWEKVRAGNCEDLRVFLASHGDGVHADEAKTRLAARRTWTEAGSQVAERPLPLAVLAGMAEPSAGRDAAMADALARGEAEAQKACKGYADAGLGKLVGATVKADAWRCDALGGGTVCAFDGQAMCKIEEVAEVQREQCGTTS